MKLSNNKILITGGGSGIGYAMAERFIKENNTVIICGRRKSVLKEAEEKLPSIITRQCDLAVSHEREALYKWIEDEHPDLNVLVNNAGIQHWMSISDPDFYQRAQSEITINLEAPVHLTSLFLNLKSINTIVNVTSALAYVPRIKAPVYSATKAFFHSFTISLAAGPRSAVASTACPRRGSAVPPPLPRRRGAGPGVGGVRRRARRDCG